MADVSIKISAQDSASSVFDHVGHASRNMASAVEQSAKSAHSSFMNLGSAIGNVASIAGGFVIGRALMELPGQLIEAGKAAAEDAASQAKLQQAVENTGASWGKYADDLNEVIEAGIKKGFSDNQTRDALSILTAQTGNATEATKRYKIAQDFARGANIDVVTAAKLLGKVTDENVAVLGRYGIAAEKGMDATELLGKVQDKFAGQADAFANSTAGMMASFNLQMGELQESIGQIALPLLSRLASFATDTLVPAIQEHVVPALENMGNAIDAAIGELQRMVQRTGVQAWLQSLWQEIQKLGAIMEPVFDGLGAAARLVLAGQFSDALEGVVKLVQVNGAKLGALLAEWGQAFVSWIGPIIPPLLQQMGELGGRLRSWILEQIPVLIETVAGWAGAFLDWVVPMIPDLLSELGKLMERLFNWIAERVPDIQAKLSQWGVALSAWVEPRIPLVIDELNKLLARMGMWFVNVAFPWIKQKAMELGQWLWAGFTEIMRDPGRAFRAMGAMLANIQNWVNKAGDALNREGEIIAMRIWEGIKNFWGQGIWDFLSRPFRELGARGPAQSSAGIRQAQEAFPEPDPNKGSGSGMPGSLSSWPEYAEGVRQTEERFGLPAGSLGGRASGGSVWAGGSYWVGERGPEIFTPSSSGTIIPNNQAMGGSGGTINLRIVVDGAGDVASAAMEGARQGLQALFGAVTVTESLTPSGMPGRS